jgi:hypothetical protein
MTVHTFNFMVGHMFFVHKLRGIFRGQKERFIMALEAFPLGDMALALDNIHMALFTRHPSGDILPMVKAPAFHFNIPSWLGMA